jgi:hypothetical protein
VSKGLRISLVVIGVVVAAAALLLIGLSLGRPYWGIGSLWPWSTDRYAYGPMLGRVGYGRGMMGLGPGAYGPGMMGFGSSALLGAEPLSVEQAQEALADYLETLGDENLQVGEVMIFDNHAYAEIVEADSGIGAMQLLVDPVTLAVYPEHGPNMMWNLKYSPMAGYGMMGWMRGWYAGGQAIDPADEMTVSPEQAVAAAQDYLDRYLPGAAAAEEVNPYYGYYTLHILREGETIGMLSVNGYSGQVFLHTWHADFVEMAAE